MPFGRNAMGTCKGQSNHKGRVMLRSSRCEGKNFTQNRDLAAVKEVLTNSAADSEAHHCSSVSIHNTPVLPYYQLSEKSPLVKFMSIMLDSQVQR